MPKDASAAAEYLWQAAHDGNAYAQYLLGKLYLSVPKDADAACKWFTEAYYGGHIHAGMFMDQIDHGEQRPPSVLLSATRLLYHMGNIFRANAPVPDTTGIRIDRKRLAKLLQKRIALSLKPDDHESEQQQGYSMKFHMETDRARYPLHAAKQVG